MTRPIRSDALRKIIAENVDKGCAVKVLPDGTISVTPPKHEDKDEFSDVRMGK